jgi:glycosyltransferase involved in cell wall biosynthesis
VKIAFYAPMKPICHPHPSGDREIARGLHAFLSEHAEVFVLSGFRARFFYFYPWRWGEWAWALAKAYRLSRREKPDIYFAYHAYYKAPDAIAFLLACWFGKPYFVFEGIYGRKNARRGLYWIGYLLNRAALRYATRIYSDKSEDFESLRQWFGGKVSYVAPSLDLSLYGPGAGPGNEVPVLVSVAMLRPGKKAEGVKLLARVLARLREEGWDFRWRHAGGGSALEEVKALAESALGAKAQFLGLRHDVPALLRGADLFAFPGIGEGFGLVFAEAQAAGLPVVAFSGRGSADVVIDGETGFLTPAKDEEAYAAALRRLLADPALRARMGAKGRERAARFDRNANYPALLEILQ